MDKKSKNKIIAVAVVSFLLLLVAGLILLSALYPMLNAKRLFYGKRDQLREAAVTSATVYDPDAAGNDVLMTPGAEVQADPVMLKGLMLAVLDSAGYSGIEKDLSLTDFDYRVRFRTDTGAIDFYIDGDSIYTVVSGARYRFVAENRDDLAALTAAAAGAFNK